MTWREPSAPKRWGENVPDMAAALSQAWRWEKTGSGRSILTGPNTKYEKGSRNHVGAQNPNLNSPLLLKREEGAAPKV